MFQDQLVPLHPRYCVNRDEDVFIVEETQNYSDVTSSYRLDVLALCGRNGVGKSTFLELLSGHLNSEADFILCWLDHKGEIATNQEAALVFCKKKIELSSRVHNFSLRDLCGNQNLGEVNSVRRSLLDSYAQKPEVFNLHEKNVFDGFHLDLDCQFSDLHELERNLADSLGMKSSPEGFSSVIQEHPLFHVFAEIAQDSSLSGVVSRYRSGGNTNWRSLFRVFRDSESDQIDSEILTLLYEEGQKRELFEETKEAGLGLKIKRLSGREPDWQRYEICEYAEVVEKWRGLSEKVDRWITSKLASLQKFLDEREYLNVSLTKGCLLEILVLRPFQCHGDKLFHLEDFSSGERSQIELLFSLGPKMLPKYACWFFEDDVDDFFHPEWKRKLVLRLLETFKEFTERFSTLSGEKNYSERTSSCLIATHSPFVLSDLPKENVLRFEREPDGSTVVCRSTENTFAGNIGELFHTEFFMDGTIGEFAQQQIKLELTRLTGEPTDEEIESAERLFKNVGDDVLRSLLLEKIQNAKNYSDERKKAQVE